MAATASAGLPPGFSPRHRPEEGDTPHCQFPIANFRLAVGGRPNWQWFDWNDQNGPATELQSRIASIDVMGTIAAVTLELDNWTGHKFTDMFTLLKIDGEWKIISKVFYPHP